MQFDWITFGLQVVNVLVLLAILRHFLFRPVAAIIARRKAGIEAASLAAEAARAEADKAVAAARARAARAEATREEALAAARAQAGDERRKLIEAAQAEASKITAEARTAAAKITAEAGADTLRRARDLAETIARKALSDMPDPPDAAGFARRLADVLRAMPDDRRRSLLSGGDVRLIAARPLSAGDLAAAAEALRPFGIADPEAQVDPGLIAGLDLRTASGAVHNSLAHDLRQISEALKDDDRSRA